MNKVYLKIIPLVILLDVQTILCQEDNGSPKKSFDEEIMTDRPDQTEAPNLTPKGWFQIETGAQREFDDSKFVRAHWEKNTLHHHALEIRTNTEF